MPMGLTHEQAHVVRIFAELADLMGCAPTVRELAAEMGCHIKIVAEHLDRLEERGWLARMPGRARGVRLLADPPPLPEETAVEITDAGRRYLEEGACRTS